MASAQQLSMFTADYDRLSDARDNAAYRALGAMSAAICFCKQERPKDALAVLVNALRRYEEANQELQSLKIQPTQENQNAVHVSN